MSKRLLTEQQQRRVRAARRRGSSPDAGSTEHRGLVVARHTRHALVEADDGRRHRCHLRANLDTLVAGDQVMWAETADGGVITARVHRRSELNRPDGRGRPRPVAANVDRMLIVIAPQPEPHANLIDRYLVAAHAGAIDVGLVLNKRDLLGVDDPAQSLLNAYRALGLASAVTGRDDPEAVALEPLIGDATVVLVGQSGVGKSSLIRRLLPGLDIRVGELSEGVAKGRHTTTTAELFQLPGGGRLIDSPGIREFQLHHLPATEVAAGFPDFRPLLGLCQYRDCSHLVEDGCAIRDAVARGDIAPARFDSFRRIVTEIS